MGRVEGKVALITGAARGQGRSHAVRLAEEGADIVAIDICKQIASAPYAMSEPDDLQETEALITKLGRRVIPIEADVRDQSALDDAAQRAVDEFGRLDIVCANAGITSHDLGWKLTDEQWDDVIAVNLTGVWRTTRACIPHMIELGNGGSIIMTSSLGGVKGLLNHAHYCVTKHGVIGLARTLANELADHAIRVNAILPTAVDTPMIQNPHEYELFMPDKQDPTREDVMPAFASLNALSVPWVDARDVSNAVLWLASDESRYVTGISLPVDAGAAGK
jgi:(+)-trans-carveol dehydrogenase